MRSPGAAQSSHLVIGGLALEHLHGLVDLFGARKGTLAMRRHAAAYLRGIPGAPSLRAGVFRATAPSEIEHLLRVSLGG